MYTPTPDEVPLYRTIEHGRQLWETTRSYDQPFVAIRQHSRNSSETTTDGFVVTYSLVPAGAHFDYTGRQCLRAAIEKARDWNPYPITGAALEETCESMEVTGRVCAPTETKARECLLPPVIKHIFNTDNWNRCTV